MIAVFYSLNIDMLYISIGMMLMLAAILSFAVYKNSHLRGGMKAGAALAIAFGLLAVGEWLAAFGIANYDNPLLQFAKSVTVIGAAFCFIHCAWLHRPPKIKTFRTFYFSYAVLALFSLISLTVPYFAPDALELSVRHSFLLFLQKAIVLLPATLFFVFHGLSPIGSGKQRWAQLFFPLPILAFLLAVGPSAGITAALQYQNPALEWWGEAVHLARLIVALVLAVILWRRYSALLKISGWGTWLPISAFVILIAVFFVFINRVKTNYIEQQNNRMLAAAEAAAGLIDGTMLANIGQTGTASAATIERLFNKTLAVGFRLNGYTIIRMQISAAVPSADSSIIYHVDEHGNELGVWEDAPLSVIDILSGKEKSTLGPATGRASDSLTSFAGVRAADKTVGIAIIQVPPAKWAMDLSAFSLRYFIYALAAFIILLVFLCSLFRIWQTLSSLEKKALEDTHRKDRDFLHSIIDAVTVPIMVKDYAGSFLFANSAFSEMFGKTPEELVGKNDSSLLSFGDVFKARQEDAMSRNMALSGKSFVGEKTLDIDGRKLSFGVVKTSKILEQDDQGITIAALYDITDLKVAETDLLAERHFLGQLIDTVPVMVCFLDMDGLVRLCDSKFCSMIGKTYDEIIGKPYRDITYFDDGDDPLDSLHVGTHQDRKLAAKDSSGEMHIFIQRQIIMVSPRGKPIGIVKSFWDTTQLVMAQKAAEAAINAKTAFLANMSHELRTPLNGIIGLAEEINSRETAFPETKISAEIIVNSSKALQMVLEEVMDIALRDETKPVITDKAFDLRFMVDDIVRLESAISDAQSKRVYMFMPARIVSGRSGDPQRLRQILLHLFSKCLNWSSSTTLRLLVDDDGAGVVNFNIFFLPKEELDVENIRALVERSEVVSGVAREKLSLPPLGKLVRMMGGSISVELTDEMADNLEKTVVRTRIAFPLPELPAATKDIIPDLSGLHVQLNIANMDYRKATKDYLEATGAKISVSDSVDETCRQLRFAYERESGIHIAIFDSAFADSSRMRVVLSDLKTHTHFGSPKTMVMIGALDLVVADDPEMRLVDMYLPTPVLGTDLWKKVEELWDTILVEEPRPSTRDTEAMRRRRAEKLTQRRSATTGMKIRAKVLLVEDNPVNQMVAKGILTRIGCNTVIAKNGLEAVEKIKAGETFDLVLMDCMMPVMNGYDATLAIREIERSCQEAKRHSIVALTANALPGDKEKCLAAGMDAYMTKPVTVEIMRANLISYCPDAVVAENVDGDGGNTNVLAMS